MENAVLEEIRNAQLRAIVCGANGAMGRLLLDRLGEEAVGLVSVDGNNGVPRTFEELGEVDADVVIDFSHHSAAPEVTKYPATSSGIHTVQAEPAARMSTRSRQECA